MAAPSEYIKRIYNTNSGADSHISLYIVTATAERTGDVVTVTVSYYLDYKAWRVNANINGTNILDRKASQSNQKVWGSPSGSLIFTISDSDMSEHTREMAIDASYWQQSGGSRYYANNSGTWQQTSNPNIKFTYTVPAGGGLDENSISKIQTLNGTVYDVCDTEVRSTIEGVSQQVTKPLKFLGITETELTDGSTTNPIEIGGESVTAVNGNVVIYDENELVYAAIDSKWHDFGSMSATGALATKDSASGTYTAAGTIGAPTFTGTAKAIQVTGLTIGGNITISASTAGTTNYRPAGTVTAPGITVALTTATVNPMTSVGSLPTMTTTVSSNLLTFGWDAGSLPVKGSNQTVATGVSSVSVTQPIFQGTGAYLSAAFSGSSVTGSYTIKPTGTVSTPSFTGTGVSVTVT